MSIVFSRRSPITRHAAISAPMFGLDYRSFPNGSANSDIRLNWLGANLPDDTQRTVLWKSFWTQQTGYYAFCWNRTYNDGSFYFSGNYEFGCHPYPSPVPAHYDGETGQVIYDYDRDTETNHWYEIAGLAGHDYLSSPNEANGPAKQVVKGVWVSSVSRIELVSGGTVVRHTYIPDIIGDPTFGIVHDIALANLEDGGPGSPIKALVLGASPWTSSNFASSGSGTTNTENPCGIHRHIMIFSGATGVLSDADCITELNNSSSVGPVTAAGLASVWYCNKNPTPSDITDKSGAGHTPTWGNANRPNLWTA